MKKYLFLIILIFCVLFIIKFGCLSVEECINENMNVNIPKPSRYENLLDSVGQDASIFEILYYVEENDINQVISELEEIDADNHDDIRLDYLKLLSKYSDSDKKIVKEKFNHDTEIINGNYYLLRTTGKRERLLFFNTETNILYYMSSVH